MREATHARPGGRAEADTLPQDVAPLRETIRSRFAGLGCYGLPMTATKRVAQEVVDVADAVDDVTVIAAELKDVLWRAEHVGADDAAWQFHHGYHHHWGEILRTLQVHLHWLGCGAKGRPRIPAKWREFGSPPAARSAWKRAR